jgi:hypothetical protein
MPEVYHKSGKAGILLPYQLPKPCSACGVLVLDGGTVCAEHRPPETQYRDSSTDVGMMAWGESSDCGLSLVIQGVWTVASNQHQTYITS